jgi:hypothetical protein
METMQPREQLPHFVVRDTTGATVDYGGSIWQRQHAVVVSLPPDPRGTTADAADYLSRLRLACADLAHAPIAYIVTTDAVPGVPSPGAVVADRWGEVVFVSPADEPGPPAPEDLAAWAKMAAMRCG